jgi:hypothetical protein
MDIVPPRNICVVKGLAPLLFDMIILRGDDKPPQSGRMKEKFHASGHCLNKRPPRGGLSDFNQSDM